MNSLLPVVMAAVVPFLIIILIAVAGVSGLILWQPPQNWAVSFGSSNSDNGVTAVFSDNSGLYATGFVGYGPSAYSNNLTGLLFLSRYDSNGREVWTKNFDNPEMGQTSGLSVQQGSIYLAGTFNNTSFITKYDINGTQLWSTPISSGALPTIALSTSPSGVYVGYYLGGNGFLRAYDSTGHVLWTTQVGNYTDSLSLYATSTGVSVLDGEGTSNTLIKNYNINGALVWSKTCPCLASGSGGITGDSSGIYAAGNAPNIIGENIVRYDSVGNVIWSTQFTAPDDSAVDIVESSADSSGAYLSLATVKGNIFLIKFDPSGKMNWSVKTQLKAPPISPEAPVSAGNGFLFVGGSIAGPSNSFEGFLSQFSQTSSLIFIGENPPLSFAILSALVIASATSLLFFRKLRKNSGQLKQLRPASTRFPTKD